MNQSYRKDFCHTTLNCSDFRDFFSDIKRMFSDCFTSTKNLCLCKIFPCLTEQDIFVDLEKGENEKNNCSRSVTKHEMFNKEPDIVNGEEMCVNCNIRKADVIIIPCGHGTFCNDCLEDWSETNQNCPSCGVAMTDVVQCI